jgi:Secretion system C-terminal sorting domain
MKKFLLIITFFAIVSVKAQVPITSFFGTVNYNYTNLNPATPLIHTTMGANAVWTFNGIPTNGTSSEVNLAPTAAELTSFPGSTSVHITTTAAPSPSNIAKIYNKLTPANVFSLTGFDANGVILNYVTNNALIGTFPLNYGYTNNDITAGTFTNGTTSGTFTGTAKTDFDSYGTLNLGVVGFDPIVKTVYRIKLAQNISLSIPFFGSIGTVTQTSYTYYVNNAGVIEPFFRDTSFTVDVPLLGAPQNTNQAQVFTSALTLGTSNFDSVSNTINFYPNPATNMLTINNKSNSSINSISISDTNGRNVLEAKNVSSTIDISDLSKGIYFVRLTTDAGSVTKKLVKE